MASRRGAVDPASSSSSRLPMIGTSSAYYDPAMGHQQGIELEYQFYNLQQQQQQQQQQAYPPQQQQQWPPQTPTDYNYYPPQPPPAQPQSIGQAANAYYQQRQFSPEQQYARGVVEPPAVAPHPQYHHLSSSSIDQPIVKKEEEPSKRSKTRKRNRIARDTSSDESDGDDGAPSRLPGACTHCKKLKMKCDFPDDGDNTCRRCRAGGHQCVVEGRKPRTAPNKREYLLAQIRQKDRTIAFLLKQVQAAQGPAAAAAAAAANAASPPSTSSFNPSLPDNAGVESDQSDAILRWLSSNRAPSAGLDGDAHIDISVTAPEPSNQEPLLSLPPEPAPLGMMARLAIRDTHSRTSSSIGDPEHDSDGEIGIARTDYFTNPTMETRRLALGPDVQTRPEILVKGIVSFEEVNELFEIFFSRLNVVLTVLDPVLHTPATTFAKCPFLFTVICATAARYYTKKPELFPVAMHFARESAGRALTHAYKSIELCQAYIILATYGVPAKRWEEDRNWLYIGVGIRIATDLNLHVPLKTKPQNEQQEREMLNRTRMWLVCFNLDRSTSTQFGKMSTLKEGFIVRTSEDWYRSNRYSSKYDIHLCAYTALLRIMARFVDEVFSDENTVTGLNTNLDWLEICNRYNTQLDQYYQEWNHRFSTESDMSDPSCVYRTHLLPFVLSYSRLVLHSFGFQHAIDRGITKGDLFFQRCIDAAVENCTTLLDKLATTTYLRFAPDGHFVFASFATAFLVKMMRPDYRHLLDQSERDKIVSLINRVVDVMGSRDISIDDKHTPKLYSRFLATLLARQHAEDKEARGRTRKVTPQSKSNTHSPAHSTASATRTPILEEFPPAPPPPPLFLQSAQLESAAPRVTSIAAQSRQQHQSLHTDGMLHADRYSEAGTEVTIEQRQDTMPTEDMLAGMHALSNPAWWTHGMMPGFTWPQQESPIFSTHQAAYTTQYGPPPQVTPTQHLATHGSGQYMIN